mmetsp:Transcript_1402/g.1600  ORF Transcript_1402/g.1600 Transcript_1402/m.1600 type:complete len:220 (+) Transcript_1402:3917-4576(+)
MLVWLLRMELRWSKPPSCKKRSLHSYRSCSSLLPTDSVSGEQISELMICSEYSSLYMLWGSISVSQSFLSLMSRFLMFAYRVLLTGVCVNRFQACVLISLTPRLSRSNSRSKYSDLFDKMRLSFDSSCSSALFSLVGSLSMMGTKAFCSSRSASSLARFSTASLVSIRTVSSIFRRFFFSASLMMSSPSSMPNILIVLTPSSSCFSSTSPMPRARSSVT